MTFSHVDGDGRAQMVDVGDKAVTRRTARAQARVVFPPEVYAALRAVDGVTRKGSVTDVAHIAGIMAAKQTANLIPLCHPLPLDKVGLSFAYEDEACTLCIEAECRVAHKTGVEMEALTAAAVAALTVYDMTKAMSHEIVIASVRLVGKRGGKRDVGDLSLFAHK